ncbi:alpha-L-rhamnosidase-related protein [Paenilisteria rocourtiae]|uniref:alpha-L-rhamnosidase n=1 Tax=Listeria rocourtiae TaxID=647910 RepID=A0A4R6ZRK7_9LIST|nr:alpha-L-rhamnosidase N-terminal domain-containing protein [Listeria rocourtiae]MBC1603408.1 family 78 glycoside hydrolase catalytic domain [Listeria rocourtiae]TDR55307.1 alpha-L-rhamnosidase [Listeria rocourtiae]
MKKINKVKINGLNVPLAIDVHKEILIDWSKEAVCQRHYHLAVIHDGKCIYQEKKQEESKKRTWINLPSSLAHTGRERFIVTLFIEDGSGQVIELEKEFYSSNPHIKNASWITRLDNPIKKEYEYFKEERTIILERLFWIEKKPETTFIDLSGLGYYTLKVNGRRVHDTYLTSDVTNYDCVVYYDTFEISDKLIQGENIIQVELGNGWYNPAPLHILGKYNVRKHLAIGKPCLLAQLTMNYGGNETEIINTDSKWQTQFGQLLANDVYIGETYIDEKEQREAQTVIIHGPSGQLIPSKIPKVKRKKAFRPKLVRQQRNEQIYDVTELISGQIAMDISSSFFGTIKMSFAEKIDVTQDLDFTTSISGIYGIDGGQQRINHDDPIIQVDRIHKTKNKALHFENEYTYHSFRYLKIEIEDCEVFPDSLISNLVAYKVHTDLEEIATFTSSSQELNALWQAGINTKLNNIHSYFEDCSRERFGYGGDIVALLDSQLVSFEVQHLLEKVFTDFANNQTPHGGITQTAPYVGIMTHGPSNGAGSIGWQLVFPKIAQALLSRFQSVSFVKSYQNKLEKHIDYLLSFDYDYIKYCCLGDWGSSDTIIKNGKVHTPDQLFCTATMYAIILQAYLHLFKTLDQGNVRIERMLQKIASVKNKIVEEFYHEAGFFASGTQSSYIFALYGELVDENKDLVEHNLLALLEERQWVLTMGIFGMSWAYEILPTLGQNVNIFKWLTLDSKESYQGMLESGNNVLSEYFPAMPTTAVQEESSINHAMFSSFSKWFIQDLVGLKLSEDHSFLMIQPFFAEGLENVKGQIESDYGTISLKWERHSAEAYIVKVNIPVGLDYVIKENEEQTIVGKEGKFIEGVYELAISYQIVARED